MALDLEPEITNWHGSSRTMVIDHASDVQV